MEAHHQGPSSDSASQQPVVGVDLGTTRVVVTFALDLPGNDACEIQITRYWLESYANADYPSTDLLYIHGEDVPYTGPKVKELLKNTDADMKRYFHMWKLLFHDPMDDESIIRFQDDLTRRLGDMGKTKYDLLDDLVGVLYKDLLISDNTCLCYLQRRLSPRSLESLEIKVVITTPPGRRVLEHEALVTAFERHPIKKGNVYLESETNAMLGAWAIGNRTHQFETGQRYLVVDAGGGTCCLTQFRVVATHPIQFAQEFVSQSILCGSETISEAYQQNVDGKLAADYPNRARTLQKMRYRFDKHCKRDFGYSNFPNGYCDPLTGLVVPRHDLQKLFDTPMTKLINATTAHLSVWAPADFIVMGGGLFENRYIRQKFQTEFASQVKFIELSNDKSHIARGAILAHKNENFIGRYVAQHSIGIMVRREMNDVMEHHPLFHKLLTSIDADDNVRFLSVEWLIRKGEEVNAKHELASGICYDSAREVVFYPDEDNDPQFEDFVVTIDVDPGHDEYTACIEDDNGFQLIDFDGNVIANLNSLTVLKWCPRDILPTLANLEYIPLTQSKGEDAGSKGYKIVKLNWIVQPGLLMKFRIKVYNYGTTRAGGSMDYRTKLLQSTKAPFSKMMVTMGLSNAFDMG
ncbi:hypothetical protein BP6252_10508 [Coleophoma cylindrospora]|uniref:Actin-like ATPase domain-containing protein n=1 Tax=Coleophoma cylindrospora TaxID=1849047 RepID=A0A3D8QSV0_9HELO|nr:hypothetical protein BP6252_10508 [Coleophoma cylindrospora]